MRQKGYIYYDKREKCWYARITITDVSGKRHNVKKRGKDKTDAKEILKGLLDQIEDEGLKAIDAARMTFNDLADYYQKRYLKSAEYRDGRKIAGLRDVQRPLGCLKNFREYLGRKKLREITYGDLYAYRTHRLETPTQHGRQRTIADWNREGAVLRRMLNIALREGWITKNPFNAGEPLIIVSFERRRDRILTLAEERRLLEACDSHPYRRHLRSLLIFLLDTGCRKSEALKLRWRSVCFATRIITIEGMTTKTLKTRQVAMTGRVFRELTALREPSDRDSDATVFGIRSNVKNSFRSVCREAGVDGLTLHSLRHSAATRLVKGQMPLQMVGRILGHSQPQTTYRYLSADLETAAQAAAIFDALNATPDVTQTENDMTS